MIIQKKYKGRKEFSNILGPMIIPVSPSSSTISACNSKIAAIETLAMAKTHAEEQDRQQYGVLLYYKYTEIPDLNDLVAFYESNCNSLGLLGRVRLSPQGVNVTVCRPLLSLFTLLFPERIQRFFTKCGINICSSISLWWVIVIGTWVGWWEVILVGETHCCCHVKYFVWRDWLQARDLWSPTEWQGCKGMWIHCSFYSSRQGNCDWFFFLTIWVGLKTFYTHPVHEGSPLSSEFSYYLQNWKDYICIHDLLSMVPLCFFQNFSFD